MEIRAREVKTGVYYSAALACDQPYSWIAPTPRSPEERFPLLVILHGLGGNHLDWSTHSRIARYAAAYRMVIAFPDGGDGWYTNAVQGGERREDDIIQDFVPHLQSIFPLRPPGSAWAIEGLSMGGYGALKLAMKHTDIFSVGVSHSGSVEKTSLPAIHPVFGDPEMDQRFRKEESLPWLAEQVLCRWPMLRPQLSLDCGLQDERLEANRSFAGHLNFLGYGAQWREMKGYHTWPYWDRAMRTLLPEIAARIGAEPEPLDENVRHDRQ